MTSRRTRRAASGTGFRSRPSCSSVPSPAYASFLGTPTSAPAIPCISLPRASTATARSTPTTATCSRAPTTSALPVSTSSNDRGDGTATVTVSASCVPPTPARGIRYQRRQRHGPPVREALERMEAIESKYYSGSRPGLERWQRRNAVSDVLRPHWAGGRVRALLRVVPQEADGGRPCFARRLRVCTVLTRLRAEEAVPRSREDVCVVHLAELLHLRACLLDGRRDPRVIAAVETEHGRPDRRQVGRGRAVVDDRGIELQLRGGVAEARAAAPAESHRRRLSARRR